MQGIKVKVFSVLGVVILSGAVYAGITVGMEKKFPTSMSNYYTLSELIKISRTIDKIGFLEVDAESKVYDLGESVEILDKNGITIRVGDDLQVSYYVGNETRNIIDDLLKSTIGVDVAYEISEDLSDGIIVKAQGVTWRYSKNTLTKLSTDGSQD